MGQQSEDAKRKILQLCKTFIPHKDFFVYFKPSFQIRNLFKTKDMTPSGLRSYVVYHYTCANCQAGYVGQTTRHLCHRVSEHQGVSHLTNNEVKNKVHSNIRDHALHCSGSKISLENFRVIASSNSEIELQIKERLLINQLTPTLNGNIGSYELLLN